MRMYNNPILANTNVIKRLCLLRGLSKGVVIGLLCLMISMPLFSLEGWASTEKSNLDHSAAINPALTASISFEYQTYKNYPGVGGWTDYPASPNMWNIHMQLTNEESGTYEIIPIFLFNERYKKDTKWIENSMAIGPLSYQARLGSEVPFPVRGVPEHAPGVVSEKVFLQRTQHSFPPSKEETGGFYDVMNMRASLQQAGEGIGWRRQDFSQKNTLNIEWDAWSIWAFPDHIRQMKDHNVSTLGPIMIKAGKNANHIVIPLVDFVPESPNNFHQLNGKHVQFIELTTTGIASIEKSSPEVHAFLQALQKEFPEQ